MPGYDQNARTLSAGLPPEEGHQLRRRMRLLLVILGVLVCLVGGRPVAAFADDVYPLPTEGQGQVDASVVQAGSCVVFSGSGFAPGTDVVVSDDGSPVKTVQADGSGAFATDVCFDSQSKVGRHTLTGRGLGANGAARVVTAVVTVVGISEEQPVVSTGSGSGASAGESGAGAGGGLPFTGVDLATMLLIAGGLVLSGVSLVVRGTRRHRQRHVAA